MMLYIDALNRPACLIVDLVTDGETQGTARRLQAGVRTPPAAWGPTVAHTIGT